MTSKGRKAFESLLKPTLKAAGFRKKGGTWHRETSDAIQVVNLQGSRLTARFYVNLGVYMRDIGKKDQPAEVDCHLRERLTQLVPDRRHLNELLNLHTKPFDAIDRSDLVGLLLKYGLRWLEKCSTVQGFRKELLSGRATVHCIVDELIVSGKSKPNTTLHGIVAKRVKP